MAPGSTASLYSHSGSHPPKSPSPSASQQQHRRGYQACDPCRKRKVKCDLGSVDNPRPPPCVRCRRESKRCEFSATRRKRKPSEVDESVDGVLRRDKRMMVGDTADDSSSRNVSPYPHVEQQQPTSFDAEADHSPQKWSEGPSTTTASQRYSQVNAHNQPTATATATATAGHFQDTRNHLCPPVYPIGERVTGASYGLEGGPPMMNRTAVELLSPAISNSHDALHLLSEAAGRTEDLNRQSMENRYAARQSASSFSSPISPMTQGGTPRSAGGSFSRTPRAGAMGNYYQPVASGPVDAQMSGGRRQADGAGTFQDPGFVDAVKAWSRLRFVRAGWLTVEEAMAYVAYYYEHLAPLSPIVVPDFSQPSTHRTLLTDEPVLAVTMLTTASRHMKPKGDGSYTRSFYIHDRLWSYLRGMIERLFWGQEKFGGHGIGSGPRAFDFTPVSKMNQKGNLRSLGTVEALLLLTDWHPRNLHFPPGDDENALLDLDAQAHSRSDRDFLENDGEPINRTSTTNAGEGRLAFQTWLEPAWRSDRMSWMLLSTAQALAFELGVFDQKSESKIANESPIEQTRKRRLRRLILVYISQSSGRLGIPSMLPLPQWANDIQPTSPADAKGGDTNIDRMQDSWIGISKIMYQANQLLFASNEQTSELIRSGRYRDQIDRFQPFFREWRHNIDTIKLVPAMRNILMIEYEYTRVYVNSLALQAVVDRWTTMSNEAAQNQKGLPTGNTWFGVLMELYRVNEQYIQEVVDASRRILQIVLDGLVPGDHLKHTPVRSCFRILSGMIFILKTFTLGAKEDDVRVSLDLQDRVVEAMRTCVVDDVHLNHAISRLLELLTTSIRTRFLRFAPLDRAGDGEGSQNQSQSQSQERPSAPISRHQSPPRSRREGSSNAWPSTNLNFMESNTSTGPNTTMSSLHDPLAGIPAQPINSSNINVSFMPPPPSVYYNYYDAASGDLEDSNNVPPHSMHDNPNANANPNPNPNAALPDWFALPLDQFFNSSTTVVDQGLGGTGPMLGEFDMLEVLLNEQHDGGGEGVSVGVGVGVGVDVDSGGGDGLGGTSHLMQS